MKIVVQRILFALLICCVPLFLVTTTLRWEVSEIRLYEYGFDTYNISHVTGIEEADLLKVAHQLIDYFNAKATTPQVTVYKEGQSFDIYNEKELAHLTDVKNLVRLDGYVQMFVLAAMIICRWRTIVRSLFFGAVLTLVLAVILALWTLFGFDQLFILFHRLSFTNMLWILDPATDYLIMMFPGEFFYDATLLAFATVIVGAVAIGLVSFGLLRIKSHRAA
jgi:integral membrane protein (TIGR01906 family)